MKSILTVTAVLALSFAGSIANACGKKKAKMAGEGEYMTKITKTEDSSSKKMSCEGKVCKTKKEAQKVTKN
jgi:Na+/citrate or Na+/malate symporter